MSKRIALLALLSSFVVTLILLYNIRQAQASPSQVVDGTSAVGTAYTSQRHVIRTTYGANSMRTFVLAYTGSALNLYYSDDPNASSPTWNSIAISAATTYPIGDMVWDESNSVIYVAYGRDAPANNNNSDILYKRITALTTTPVAGTARTALNGASGGTTYNLPNIEIAGDSSTTKVFVFGSTGASGGNPTGWSVAAGTINSDNPTWTTYSAKTWTAAAAGGIIGVTRVNTNKLVVLYYNGTDVLATRHDDSSAANATSGWDALDGTDNSQTTISSDDPPSRGKGTATASLSSDNIWFGWLDASNDINTRRWNGSGLDTEMTPVAFAAATVGPALVTDGVHLYMVYQNDSDATQLVYQVRSATDGTTSWSGTKTTLDDLTENITYPGTAKKLYQGKLDITYTTATNFIVRHVSTYKVAGFAYQESASSPYEGTTVWSGCDGSTANLGISIAGGTKVNAVCSSSDGSFYFVLPQPSGNDADITIFLDTGGGNKGVLFTHNNDAISDITGLTLFKDKVWIESQSSTSITNSDINSYDQSNDSDIPIASDGTTSTVDAGFELHINTGDTFAPGGSVTTPKLHLKGTYTGASETLTLNGSGSSSTCDDTVSNLRPFCLDGGTFTPSSNTVLFTGGSTSLIEVTSYNHLRLEPGGNSITHTLRSGTLTIGGNLTLGNGTNTSVVIDFNTNDPTVTLTGNLAISANTTLQSSSSSTFSISGNWTNSGTFSHNSGLIDFTKSSSTQTVNNNSQSFNNVTHSGAGTLQLSTTDFDVNGAFSQTGGTFDANSRNQNYASTFTLSSGTTYTKGGILTFDGTGSSAISDNTTSKQDLGTVVIDGTTKNITTSTDSKVTTLTIGADDTLNINSDTLTIAGTGTPFTITGGGTFTTTGSTVIYTGTTTATNITTTAYNHLSLTPSATTTYNLTGHLTGSNAIAGNLTINTNATLDAISGSNYNLTLAGSWSNSGTFTAQNNTVTLAGADASTQSLTGNTTFYNLVADTSSNTTGRTLQFAGSSTTTVIGTWTITGYSGKVLTLQSSDTNAWNISPTTATVDYATVSRSNSSLAICATHSTDGLNNTSWTFTSGAACIIPSNLYINGLNFSGITIQ